MMIELVGGFFVVFIYYSTVIDKRGDANFYPLMIGLAYFFLTLIFGIEMTVMINPSKFLATSIVNLDFNNLFIYPLSSTFGGLWAAFMFERFILKNQPKDKVEKIAG